MHPLSIRRAIGAAALAGTMGAGIVGGQLPGRVAAPRIDSAHVDSTTAPTVSPRSPRAALTRYLELARAGRYEAAAAFLEPSSARDNRAQLAKQLKLVLDRNVWFDLPEVSALASGDTADGLASDIEQVALIGDARERQPVRLRRVLAPAVDSVDQRAVYWRFSAGTVARIPQWYNALGGRFITEHLPEPLLRPGPWDVLWWQWLVILVLVLLALLAGRIAGAVVIPILRRTAQRSRAEWDDAVVDRITMPIVAAGGLAVLRMTLPLLGLYRPATERLSRVLLAALMVVVFWTLWRLVDVAREVASRSVWARTVSSSRSLLPLGARTAKVLVLAMALVAVLSLLGFPVASLLAGFGLGGLALALAAQKTVENVFGAFSIGVDQPFREGDFVKIEEFVGTVEAIGLRSTRFRTLDRTLITIPNGRLAEMRLESFTARDRLRLAMTIGLVYETTQAQMRHVLDGFDSVLRAHPRIWPDAVVVRFAGFGASSLDIEIMAWFLTADWSEFQRIRQEILLAFMSVVETAGSSFAFPTQTVYLAAPSTEKVSA